MSLRRRYILLLLNEVVYWCQLCLIDDIVDFNSVLTDFLLARSLYFCKRGVEVADK